MDYIDDQMHHLEQIGEDIMHFLEFTENPKYQAELKAIHAKEQAIQAKVAKHFKADDEGLDMWKLHMNNGKTK